MGAAAERRICRRQADFLWAVALGAQGGERDIREVLSKLRRAGSNLPPEQQDQLIVLTDG